MSQSFDLGKARFETVSEQQRGDPGWKPFPWCMDWNRYRTMGGRIIYGEALHPGVTLNFDEYTRREVELSARMLIGKPLEIDRHGNLMEAENVVLDAEPVGGNIQYVARVLDENAVKRIDEDDIRWVSFNGMCRRTPDFVPGVEPRGCEGLLIFRLCLVGESSPHPPGDPKTSVHVWATLGKATKLDEKTVSLLTQIRRERPETFEEPILNLRMETLVKPVVVNFDKLTAEDIEPVEKDEAVELIKRRIERDGK